MVADKLVEVCLRDSNQWVLVHVEVQDHLLASNNPFALVTLAHLRSQRERHDADALLAAKWELTCLLYEHRWSKRRIIVLFKVINWMMALPEPQQARFWHAVLKLEKERKMDLITPLEQSFMDKGWQKGLAHGLEQGREEGCREGAAELLARQLAQRFGPLSQAVIKKLNKANMEQLPGATPCWTPKR